MGVGGASSDYAGRPAVSAVPGLPSIAALSQKDMYTHLPIAPEAYDDDPDLPPLPMNPTLRACACSASKRTWNPARAHDAAVRLTACLPFLCTDALALPTLFPVQHDPVLRRPPTATLPTHAREARKRYYDEGEKNWGAGTQRHYRHYLYRNMQPAGAYPQMDDPLRKPPYVPATPMRWGGATVGNQSRPGPTVGRSGPGSTMEPMVPPWQRHNLTGHSHAHTTWLQPNASRAYSVTLPYAPGVRSAE